MDEQRMQASVQLRRLVNGYQVSQAISVVARLGIADLIAEGRTSATELASACGADSDALYRVLRALASVGVFEESEDRRFALTALGDCLRSDAPAPVAAWAAFIGESYHWQAWAALGHSVRTGECAFQQVHGTDAWTFRARHPELSASFDRAMADTSRQVARSVLAGYDFSRYAVLVDVGGGTGSFLSAILAAQPAARGILFDQPHVVAGAGPVLDANGVADRCTVVAGNFFDEVPAGGDAYILKAILHDWDDAPAVAILKTCRRAMASGATLLVVERELGGFNVDPDTKFGDLNMLVGPGGRERTATEFSQLLAASGFRYGGFTRTTAGPGVFEGTAA